MDEADRKRILQHGQDQAFRTGASGFRSNFSTIHDIAALQPEHHMTEVDLLYATDISSLPETMQTQMREAKTFFKTMRWAQANKEQVDAVESELTAHLKQAGLSDDQLKATTTLRTQSRALYDLTYPPSPPNFVMVKLYNEDKTIDLISIPLVASFAEGCALLRDFLRSKSLMSCNDTGHDPSQWHNKPLYWKYQLWRQLEQKGLSASFKLRSEGDWRRMMQAVQTESGAQRECPVAVLAWEGEP